MSKLAAVWAKIPHRSGHPWGNFFWFRKTRWDAVSSSIKILPVDLFVLSQCTCLTDGQTTEFDG